jgi:hypothetical protein
MLAAQVGEKFGGGTGASGGHIFVALADAFDGLIEILTFPVEIGSQSFIERGGRVLAMALGVFFQLRAALRLERNRIHVLAQE